MSPEDAPVNSNINRDGTRRLRRGPLLCHCCVFVGIARPREECTQGEISLRTPRFTPHQAPLVSSGSAFAWRSQKRPLITVSGTRAGIVSVYQKYQYGDESSTALEQWAAHVAGIVGVGLRIGSK